MCQAVSLIVCWNNFSSLCAQNFALGKVTLVFEFASILSQIMDTKEDSFEFSDEDIKCFNIYPKSQ